MPIDPTQIDSNGIQIISDDRNEILSLTSLGLKFNNDRLTGEIITTIGANGFDFDGEQVSWDNIYNLRLATSALRLPATPNTLTIDDTLEVNDNNLLKTRTAVLNAPPLLEPSLTLTNITSGDNSVLTTETLTLNQFASTNSSVLYANGTLQLNDIANGSVISLTPDGGLRIDVLPFPSTKNLQLDAYNGLVLNDTTIADTNSTLTSNNLTITDLTSGDNTTFSNGLITTVGQISVNSGDNIGLNATVALIANATDDIQLNVTNNNITLNALNSQIVSNASGFVVNASDFISLTANNDYMTLQADDDITLNSSGLGNIILNAPNINSYNWANPISFNQFEAGNWSYTLGGQTFEDVFSASPIIVPLPVEFFALNPQSGYTSSRWELNFDMNCWNFANAGDKGFAIYLSFLDTNGNLYEPFLYNQLTPFCKWDNPPTFSGAFSQFKSINFCDRIDLGGLQGSNDSNLRLQMNIAGDNVFLNVDFKFKLGFTRINRI